MAHPRPRTHPATRTGPLRCVIYTRISRDDTMLGRANDRQQDKCRAKALYKEYDVVAVVDDVSVSAYSGKDRPGWQRVLQMVRDGEVDIILAYHMDRITRSMKDLEELIDLALETGVGIDTATGDIELTSDMGRMVARILAAVARAEVERKSRRQRDANEQRAMEGKPFAIKCFGYEHNGLNVIEDEAEAIQNAAQDVLYGGYTLTEIRDRWVSAFPDRAPKTPAGVRMALLNPRYAGIRMYLGANMGLGQWPTILDMETHMALRRLLEDPTRVSGSVRSQGRKPTTLLGGIAKCKVCEQATKATRAHGVAIYGCHGGNHVNTPRDDADAWVLASLCDRLARPDILEKLAPQDDGGEFDTAREEVAVLRRRKDELAQAFALGAIDQRQLTMGSSALDDQMKMAEKVLSRAPMPVRMDDLALGTPAVVEQVMDLPLARQRGLVESWLRVTLVPRGKGNRGRKARAVPVEEQVLVDELF